MTRAFSHLKPSDQNYIENKTYDAITTLCPESPDQACPIRRDLHGSFHESFLQTYQKYYLLPLQHKSSPSDNQNYKMLSHFCNKSEKPKPQK